MAFFRIKTKEGSDDSYSTLYPSIWVNFPILKSWASGVPEEVAQLVHIPKSNQKIVVKAALKYSTNINIPDFSLTFPYSITYNTRPPGLPPSYTSVNFSYTYNSSVDVRLSSISVDAALKLYENKKSTNYGLSNVRSYTKTERLFSDNTAFDENGNIRFTIIEFNSQNIQPGWYWFCLTLAPKVLTDVVPESSIKNIALKVKDRVEYVARDYITKRRENGDQIYDYTVNFYNTDVLIKQVDDKIRDYIISKAKLIGIQPAFYDGFTPYGLGSAYYSSGGYQMYFVSRFDIGNYQGQVPYAFAIRSGQEWQFPDNDRYMIVKVEKGAEADSDFDVQVRFSLKGDIADASCWTNWENFHGETGWQAKGLRELFLTDPNIGGSSNPGTRNVYVNFKRRVFTSPDIVDQYSIGKASVYFSGNPPIVTMVRVAYLSKV